MLEKVSACYPNTYRGMDERQRARIIDEWFKALEKYPVHICQKAWEKYKSTMRIRELNIGFFVGLIKDIQEAERREQARKALPIPEDPDRNKEWETAREKCMKKCAQVFRRSF